MTASTAGTRLQTTPTIDARGPQPHTPRVTGETIITVLPKIKKRPLDMHKGDAGYLFAVAGSVGMAGAAALCSRAAMRCGVGMVRVACPGAWLLSWAAVTPT
jgi:NAD(P)H-hydrate repair Nnr-like enzyme with NAD(P)H-hydrate dehydratase domain